MAKTIEETNLPICIMHAQGDPRVMQDNPEYDSVVLDVYDFLADRVAAAVTAGIRRANIVIDPGIGFGKTHDHNLQLIRNIGLFHSIGCPILIGVSRKGFIGKIGGQPDVRKRAAGSIAMALEAVRQGVQIIRAHDIEEHRQAVYLWQALMEHR